MVQPASPPARQSRQVNQADQAAGKQLRWFQSRQVAKVKKANGVE